jgi:hypothetical protein
MTFIEGVTKVELNEIVEAAVRRVLSESITQNDKPEVLLTRRQASHFLNISLATLHKHTKDGIIVGQRIGSRLLYRQSDLEGSLKKTVKNINHE